MSFIKLIADIGVHIYQCKGNQSILLFWLNNCSQQPSKLPLIFLSMKDDYTKKAISQINNESALKWIKYFGSSNIIL
jgi:hypothetical protein